MPTPGYTLFGEEGAAGGADGNWNTHGLQYIGFRRYERQLLTESVLIVWGLWMTQDVSCASGDFHGCG